MADSYYFLIKLRKEPLVVIEVDSTIFLFTHAIHTNISYKRQLVGGWYDEIAPEGSVIRYCWSKHPISKAEYETFQILHGIPKTKAIRTRKHGFVIPVDGFISEKDLPKRIGEEHDSG